jgi:hypothetical protein
MRLGADYDMEIYGNCDPNNGFICPWDCSNRGLLLLQKGVPVKNCTILHNLLKEA